MGLPAIGWDERSILNSPVDGAGGRLPRPTEFETTFLEAMRRAVRMIDLGAVVVRCPVPGIELREGEMREIFRSPAFADLAPIEDHEARLVTLDGTCDRPLVSCLFQGRAGEARRRVLMLTEPERAKAWLITHRETFSPAGMLENRPSPIEQTRRKRRFLGLAVAG